jgi:radical SAM superfamily enzyme YgiQ (UPF0313 family)
MRILLVKPKWFVEAGHYLYFRNVRFSQLSLGILAALSDGHDVRIVDGDWDSIPLEASFDLVGISTVTFSSERAYELAKHFRHNGAQVVLGGVHASIMSAECIPNANSVVIGEAEYVWKDVLKDAEKRTLKPVYLALRPTEMSDVPFPRRDLLGENSWFACIQATRGCPNSCKYCYLPYTPWSLFRKRPVELVAEEVQRLKQKVVFIVDDNIFADREYVLSLFRVLSTKRKSFAIQAPTTIGQDEELLDLMAEAGFVSVLIGFQSVNRSSLKWACLQHNRVEDYETLTERIHARGMMITGFFIFGFDTDDPGTFERTVEMIRRIRLDTVYLYILTPYPGTTFYSQLEKEGRLLTGKRRSHFGWSRAVFLPKNMSPEALENGVQTMAEKLSAMGIECSVARVTE